MTNYLTKEEITDKLTSLKYAIEEEARKQNKRCEVRIRPINTSYEPSRCRRAFKVVIVDLDYSTVANVFEIREAHNGDIWFRELSPMEGFSYSV